ncbi:AAA family ATPase, partial [bacterium]|nr:AAA family ATPase [bacterium]
RDTLRSFYSVLKDRNEVKFIMFTGVSKFSKAGVFSGLNNLKDISMSENYGDIVGYTQKELEDNFVDWLEKNGQKMSLSKEELLGKIKKYYDGFSFDGKVRVYNPFSVLNFFDECDFRNYWYISGLPSFLVKYFKKYGIASPDKFRHIEVESDFADEHEIESSTCESFLYQAGYLTIEKKESDKLTLDYPNWEVLRSINRLYVRDIYQIENYLPLGEKLWNAIQILKDDGNIKEIVGIFNSALEKIPSNDFPKNKNEYWYRSLFVMLLRGGAGVTSFQESFSKNGRSDLIIPFDDKIIIIEFKFTNNSKEVDKKRAEGEEQVKKYAESYKNEGKKIITAVFVADDEKRQVVV